MHSTTSLLPTPVASVEAIRARFPALQREQRHEPVAYFDGPGGTQVPRDVVEAMSDYLYNHNANTHWAYPTSQETDLAIHYLSGTLHWNMDLMGTRDLSCSCNAW